MVTSEALRQEAARKPGRTPACSEAAVALKVPGQPQWQQLAVRATCGARHSWED